MKILAVFLLVALAAATALAYGHPSVAGITVVATQTAGSHEPITLLLSGAALLGVAGALRRFLV
jgi:hypothetical protein